MGSEELLTPALFWAIKSQLKAPIALGRNASQSEHSLDGARPACLSLSCLPFIEDNLPEDDGVLDQGEKHEDHTDEQPHLHGRHLVGNTKYFYTKYF